MTTLLRKIKLLLFVLSLGTLLGACTKDKSIYAGIPAEGDGVVAVDIPEDNEPPVEEPLRQALDVLSETEKKLVDDLHNGEDDQLSFIVVDVDNGMVMRSYLANEPRRLASVSKIQTALGALEEVNNVSISKVSKMLKTSNNGEASRYVRLAAKAINGTVSGKPYTQAHSCPSEFLNDEPAAHVVEDWLHAQLPDVDWADSSVNDGAGCHYENFMNSYQVAYILELADSKGQKYGGMSFERLLSISGTDGTWKNKNKDHKGRILAKTGTLNPNSNLAGYFYAKRAGKMKKYYFTVFIQKKGGGSHTTQARKLIESLLRYWIKFYSVYPGEPISEF